MGKYEGYHTALENRPNIDTEIREATFDFGKIFQYDLFSEEYPDDFASCDVLYCEPPWRHGFTNFELRAGVASRSYDDFLCLLMKHINYYKKPAVIITGKHAVSKLPGFSRIVETSLNGNKAVALFYGLSGHTGSTVDICRKLALSYDRVGDFCAGYGRTGQIFLDHGKQFVLSDYNLSCIGYMNERFGSCKAEN